jgi:dephospho-CoA kinase
VSFVVGLTGGIGSGKSAAADEFARLGATVVDTDVIAHELTLTVCSSVAAVEKLFGKEFVAGGDGPQRIAARTAEPAAKRALEGCCTR